MSDEFSHLTAEPMGSVVVIRITEADLNIAGAIESVNQELVRAVEQANLQNVLLDLDVVGLISSLMLGKLIRLHDQMSSGGGKLVLCNLQPQVNRVFAIARLTKIIDIKTDVAEGLASF